METQTKQDTQRGAKPKEEISKTMRAMEVGDVVSFDITRIVTVRNAKDRLQNVLVRMYSTKKDDGKIIVTRTA